MPFSVDEFFDVFAAYNRSVWPMQWVLFATALVIILLAASAIPNKDRVIGTLLSFLWAWVAVAYHLAQFSYINPAAYLFALSFLAQAALLLWSSWRSTPVRFSFSWGVHGGLSAALLAYALIVYPLVGAALGHHYPRTPTFGVPCPTTIFTLGMLSIASGGPVRLLVVIPMLWAVIGGSAAFLLDVPQDLGLIAAGALSGVGVLVRSRYPAVIEKT